MDIAAHRQSTGIIGPAQFIDLDGDGDREIYCLTAVLENLGLPPRTLAVAIDIKPGDATNMVNPFSNGALKVALLGAVDLGCDAVTTPRTHTPLSRSRP